MSARPGSSAKCFFVAWIFGWVTAIYFPSALIALFDLSPLAQGRNFAAATFAVADEVAPAMKIGFALVVAAAAALARRLLALPELAAIALDMLLACLAMLLVLAFLPPDWSRGFGIGLTGTRFHADTTAIYAVGGMLSGLVFSMSERRCLGRTPAKRTLK